MNATSKRIQLNGLNINKILLLKTTEIHIIRQIIRHTQHSHTSNFYPHLYDNNSVFILEIKSTEAVELLFA